MWIEAVAVTFSLDDLIHIKRLVGTLCQFYNPTRFIYHLLRQAALFGQTFHL